MFEDIIVAELVGAVSPERQRSMKLWLRFANAKDLEFITAAATAVDESKDNDEKLEPALELAASDLEELWRYAYDQEPGNSIIDCFWHSWNFLGKHGGVHYNELITSWIMEGCLNYTNKIDKAYLEGHKVLMKMQMDNIIVLEGVTLEMKNYCGRGYLGNADPFFIGVTLKGSYNNRSSMAML